MAGPKLLHVGVIGSGQMGGGIAQVCASAGCTVTLSDRSEAQARRGREAIGQRLERLVAKGRLNREEATATLQRISIVERTAHEQAELVIEAVSEDETLKVELFRALGQCVPETTLLASNTSSISITKLGAASGRPDRVLGLHFMNPVPLMQLVEVVRGLESSQATIERGIGFARSLGKTTILSADRPGFLVNRVLIPMLNEACFAAGENIGSYEDIDCGARLGLNHPMGPLELADLIGLDTVLAISEVLHRELGDSKYRPAPLLKELVAAGWLGRKTARGFYVYDSQGKATGSSRPQGGA